MGDDSAEIAHEALIREWPRLRGWLAEDREELRALRQLTTAARSWEETGRDDADLYRGPRLAAAVELAGDERQLSRVEREFLEASRDAQDARAAERAAPGASSARPARGRRGRAGGGGDRGILRAGPARKRAAHGDGRPGRTARRPVAGGRGAAPGPRAPARARSGPARRLGRLPRCAPRRARARLADPRVAPGVRLARRTRTAFSPDGQAPGDRDAGRDHALGHGDVASGRAAAAIVAGRLGGGRLQPRRADAGDRGREGPRRAVGRVDQEGASGADGPGGRHPINPCSPSFATAPTAASSPRARRRRTTSRCGTTASGRVIGRPITTNPPGTGGAQSISFSPDSKRIAVPGAPGTVGIWEVATGRRVGEPLAIGSEDVEEAIFAADGRTLIASDDSGSVSMVDVANGTTDPPAAVGRRRACRLAGPQPGRTAAGRGFVRRVGLRVGREDRHAVRLPADGRHEPGQRRRVQPGRPDPGELAPALGGRLEHERRAGDRRAAGRADRSDHRRVLQPRRQAARRGAVRRRRRSCTTRRRDGRLSGSTAIRSSPRSPSTPMGSSSPSERSTGRCDSSIRGRGAAVGSPLDAGSSAGLAGRLQPGRPAARGGRRPERRGTGSTASSGRARCSSGTWTPGVAWGGRSRRAADRCSPWPSTRTARCWRPAATRAARPVGRGHPGPPWQADEGGGRRRPERRVRSERPARRRRRSDRTGAGVARGRSAAGVSAPRRPHRPRDRGGLRPGRLVPRDHEPVRRDQAVGPGHGSRLRRRAGRKREARLARRRPSTFRSWGCGTRSARTASCWPPRESTTRAMLWDVDPAVWRRRACAIVGPEPEPRGVEALPAAGDALSRDVPGVAQRLTRSFGRADPCRTVRNCSLCATNVGLPGASCRALQTGTLGEVISMGGAR